MIYYPQDQLLNLAHRAKSLRLARNLTQAELAERIGVGIATVKRFEKTGSGSIEMLINIAFALNAEEELEALFAARAPTSIDVLTASPRLRARLAKDE